MKKITPLLPGATIGVIAPSSPPPDATDIERGLTALRALGYKVKEGKHIRKRLGYLTGTDAERLSDLVSMFTDRTVDAVLCERGGYGSSRFLHKVPYERLKKNPKPLIGFSDVTALHCALSVKSKLITYHAPMLVSLFAGNPPAPFPLEKFLRFIQDPFTPLLVTEGHPLAAEVEVIRKGKVEGTLIGGNLCTLCSLLGTPYFPSLRGKILFLEEVSEAPYKIDRFLTQLLLAGKLQQVAGIALGIFSNCQDPRAKEGKEYRQTLLEVLQERLTPLRVPVVYGLPFGHVNENVPLPIGGKALLDAGKGEMWVWV